MTKLSPAQEQALAKMRVKKDGYDKWLELAEHDLAVKKEEKKDELRKLVREAREDNIPVRQIHIKGLGYAQVGSMEKFLQPRVERQTARIDRLTQPVQVTAGPTNEPVFTPQPMGILVRDDGKKQWWVDEDADGNTWKATIAEDGGEFTILNAPRMDEAGVPDEVREAFRNFKPGRKVWWGIEELREAVYGPAE